MWPYATDEQRSHSAGWDSGLVQNFRGTVDATRQCWSERNADNSMKFGDGLQRVQTPSGQSLASGPVARLAAPAVTMGLMRSQASKWAVGWQPRNHRHSGAQGFTAPEGSIFVSALASERRTGGVVDHGECEHEV